MIKYLKIIIVFGLLVINCLNGQSIINVYPDSLITSINTNLKPGVFYVPKTANAAADFFGNGIQQNAIRTSVIESVLNNTSNLTNCLSLLTIAKTDLQNLSVKCDKLIFVIEKMPAWLSSSSNSAPAATPGWAVLNTKPPANWNTWQTVIDSIASKIVNQFGISNAYFEVWNEPDIGSWTGTMAEYFTLYKRTYDGVKSANASVKVGGPTVNFWANNIYWKPKYGYISNSKADSSLIGQLLDSSVIWNKLPDFISWHNFNLSYQEFSNAENYIQQKLASLFLPSIPLIISEWNAPSQVRDTRMAAAFMIKSQLAFAKTIISNNVIAAWQDFSPNASEFHKDYGLLTYGAIHKPAYNSILLSNKLNGTICKTTTSSLYDGLSTIINDTLSLLISNYCPSPFLEALNHTLYQGKFNINQLDSAGYISIATSSIQRLDSIYKSLITIPNNTTLQIAINNSISIYQHYDSIDITSRTFSLKINSYTGNYTGELFIVDSTKNNLQFKYDSLINAGLNQTAAISAILPNQSMNAIPISINNGQYTFSLQPNAVCLFKIKIPGISSVRENNSNENNFSIYPNPVNENLTIHIPKNKMSDNKIQIFNTLGVLVKTIETKDISTEIDISTLLNGLYFVQLKGNPNQIVKLIKQ